MKLDDFTKNLIIDINNYLKNWIKNIIYIIKYNKNIKELGFNANLIYKNWTIKKIEIYFRFL